MGICSRHPCNEFTLVFRETRETVDIQQGTHRRHTRRRFFYKWISLFLFLIITTSVVITEVYLNLDTRGLIHKVLIGVVALPSRELNSAGSYLVEYPHEYHFTINQPEKCEQQKPFLVLIVPVVPHNRADRDIIRRTWGGERKVLGKVVTLFFLLGRQTGGEAEQVQQRVLQESKEHRDLIQSDFLDSYKNLTIKTMVMMEWLAAHCSSASYAMKIDSDIFLNLNNLITMLLLLPPQGDYMTGFVECEAVVLRNPSSKWYLPVELFPETYYPCYTLGLAYVFSLDLPQKLVEASRHVQALYIEDVYLGMCMSYLRIPPTYPQTWNSFSFSPLPYDRCIYSEIIATTTPEYTDRLWVWSDFKSPGPLCQRDDTVQPF
ncbi:beta-1,3-galactosyltransferase 1-like [Genypterus blacodes]|uniref:beta-1,3-galactosyltransferase 1-like n=1 Tax=Genypterus blacodes TaxID=154954 RepID=UPI003F75EF40